MPLTVHFIIIKLSTPCYRSKINFAVDNPQDIQRKSHLCINTRNLYAINNNNAIRTPHPYGVLDHKLVSSLNKHFSPLM